MFKNYIFNKKSLIFRYKIIMKFKKIKYKKEKISVFHINKHIFSYLKKHERSRKIYFFFVKKNTKNLFLFNKPKSKVVKKKKKVIGKIKY